MNHDYAHCADFTEECPIECFRAELVRDLEFCEKPIIVSYCHFKGTEECEIIKGEG